MTLEVGAKVEVPGYHAGTLVGRLVGIGPRYARVEVTAPTTGRKHVRTFPVEHVKPYVPVTAAPTGGQRLIFGGVRYTIPEGVKASEFIAKLREAAK